MNNSDPVIKKLKQEVEEFQKRIAVLEKEAESRKDPDTDDPILCEYCERWCNSDNWYKCAQCAENVCTRANCWFYCGTCGEYYCKGCFSDNDMCRECTQENKTLS